MRNWINLITEFQLQDVEKMITTGGGSEPPKPPEDGGDPWDDDNGGGDNDPPKEPTYNNKFDFSKLDEFTRSYLETMLWTEEEHIADDDGWKSYFSSIHQSAIDSSVNDCHAFQMQNSDTLEDAFDHGYSMSQAGHDFWLTRNHHGAGFWDRDELSGELGKKLTDESQKFGECSVGAGDQGEIYID